MLRAAIEQAGIGLRAVDMAAANGVSIHDRRGGDLEEIVDVPGSPLTRHEVDELYGAALVEALGAHVCVLAGAAEPPVAAPSLYERLTRDLRNNNRCVVADVAGPYLHAVVAGGVSVLKVSVEQLQDDGLVADDSDAAVVNCAEELRAAGAGAVVVTRADQGLIAATDSGIFAARAPEVTVVEARGAGDSLTAGIATVLGRGGGLDDGVRVGTAAGVLNVTRRGLGTGSRREIEELARTVELRPLVRQE
jgi:1-phosphofructokinase